MQVPQDILIAIAATAMFMLFVGLMVWLIVSRVSKRRYRRARGRDARPAAVTVRHAQAEPVFRDAVNIHGLSYRPDDPLFAYAGDVQVMVDAMNRKRDEERHKQSMERLRETLTWMDRGPSPSPSPAAKPTITT